MGNLGPIELKIFRGPIEDIENAFAVWRNPSVPHAPLVEQITVAPDGAGVILAVLFRRPRSIPL